MCVTCLRWSLDFRQFSCGSWKHSLGWTGGHSGRRGGRGRNWHTKTNHREDFCSNWIHSSGRIWEQTCPKGTVICFWCRRVGAHQQHQYSSTVCVFFYSQVHRVLPQWLAQPDVIHRDIKSHLAPISDIPGLSAQLVKKLQNTGIHHFFPGNDTSCILLVCIQQQWLRIGPFYFT